MDAVWNAPGPGQWTLDRSHLPGGCTRIMQHLMLDAEPAGTRRVLRELGAPIDCIDVGFVNGWLYTRIRPLIGADRSPTRRPPRWLMRAVVRLHPEMRRRARRSAEILQSEPWREVIDRWHHGMKAEIEQANLALQDVELPTLDDRGLLRHVVACLDNCRRHWETHFWLHGYDLGPLGRYIHDGTSWGIGSDELLSLLHGASPSTTAPAREADEIRRMVEASGTRPTDLDSMRAISAEIADAVDRYLRCRSWVLFSRYDIDGVTLGERPDLVVASLTTARRADADSDVAARVAALRARVPEQHRVEFDELLDHARAAMDLRDDNGPVTAEWPLGLVRRALREVGARMVAAGTLEEWELALELYPAEFDCESISGLPDADTLATRRANRREQLRLDPPRLIGPSEPPPALEALPEAQRRHVATTQTLLRHLGMDADAQHVGDGLAGTGIGSVAVRAIARVAASPEEALDRLEPGEILVVMATTPAYNLVASIAGGLVTADGGPMSHAAVIARELGIPAVVGAWGALQAIPDGALVELDPVTGLVVVVSAAPTV